MIADNKSSFGPEDSSIIAGAISDVVRHLCANGQTRSEIRDRRLQRLFGLLRQLDKDLARQLEQEVADATSIPMIRPEQSSESVMHHALRLILEDPTGTTNPAIGALSDVLLALRTPGYCLDVVNTFRGLDPETRSLASRIVSHYAAHGTDDELDEATAVILSQNPTLAAKAGRARGFDLVRGLIAKKNRGHPGRLERIDAVAPGDWRSLIGLAIEFAESAIPSRSFPDVLELDPARPCGFDDDDLTSRSSTILDAWWDRPFARTRADGNLDVLCLDGSAEHGVSNYGVASSLTDALEIARTHLERRKCVRMTPLIVHGKMGADIVLATGHPGVGHVSLVEGIPTGTATEFMGYWSRP